MADEAAAIASRIACVSQRQGAIRGSILDNLTMYAHGPAVESAIEAARLIGLDADVNRLPTGYDTRVADGLLEHLPSGLIPRVAIARAISRRPGLLVLDEANSALDMAADRALLAGLTALRGTTTIILITNRPSTAAIADRHYTIVDGKLVQRDTQPATQKAEARPA